MTLSQAYNQGYVAGIEGRDPRECPFPNMTAEWKAWNEGQRWGAMMFRACNHEQEVKEEK